MLVQHITTLLPLLLGAFAAPSKPQSCVVAPQESCEDVHFIGVRGTTEDPGFGAMVPLVAGLEEMIPESTNHSLVYPAEGIVRYPNGTYGEVNFTIYKNSVQEGYDALKKHITDYVSKCNESKIVLMGYSQGAQIVGDVLCGSYGLLFPNKAPIDTKYKKNIRAIIQLGDPTNRGDLDWHEGTSRLGGMFPRAYLEYCKDLGSVWQSYCDRGDQFCASGFIKEVHLKYVQKYGGDVIAFVHSQVKKDDTDYRRKGLEL